MDSEENQSYEVKPEKRYGIEYRTGRRPAWLAAEKLPSRASFVGDGSFRGCPVRAHFPRMKPWKAWVHFHRKYSTYRQELNHAQPARASGLWYGVKHWLPRTCVGVETMACCWPLYTACLPQAYIYMHIITTLPMVVRPFGTYSSEYLPNAQTS